MFLDASAVVAILACEPGYEEIEKRLAAAERPIFASPLVAFEAALGLARLNAGGKPLSAVLIGQALAAIDAFVEDLDIRMVPITLDIGRQALEASATYGKVAGHPADLNFGDCFSYACAKALGAPLLYKGHDFARTDLS